MLLNGLTSILAFGLIASNMAAAGQLVANNTPRFGAAAKNMGPVDPTSTIEVSIWLNVHNRSGLDALAQDLYNPKSPNYRHWLSGSEFAAEFAPTAAEAKTVQDFFTANHLSIVNVGPDNFFVRARGTVANVQNAFHVMLNNYELKGQIVRGNTGDPTVDGPAGPLVAAVYGLDSLQYTHPYMTKASTPIGKPAANLKIGSASNSTSNASSIITSNCFTGTRTESFTTGGTIPSATYTGNGYTESIEGCGYSPAEIHTAYNLNGLYKEGFDGTGQTIVIIDWCGSPTIESDANVFSATFGLPKFTSATFKQIPYPTLSTCSAPDPEINIDVEWSHAVAPGAAVDLVIPPTASFDDVDTAVLYAVVKQLGSVISGSYGSTEIYTPTNILDTESLTNEVAATLGESTNFSSADGGDGSGGGYGTPSVSAPADSPWATAVGGVTVRLNSDNTIRWQTGWGNNYNFLYAYGEVYDPPNEFQEFFGGSGGGASAFFKKPWYQAKLPGTTRQVPDISWLADPFTGAIIAITEPFTYPPVQYTVYGGTSVACPMFAALWAIANQEAGFPLGQAAPYLYSLSPGAITDVVPVNSSTNVSGSVTDYYGTTSYTAAQLAGPLGSATSYVSALWDYPLNPTTVLLTFGTDYGLTITNGWDNVTGLGTPNGKTFADAFALLPAVK
jgi:subtilase family serine protease